MAIPGSYGKTPLASRFNKIMQNFNPTGDIPFEEVAARGVRPPTTGPTEADIRARTRLIMNDTGKPEAEARIDAIQQLSVGRESTRPSTRGMIGDIIPQTPYPLPEGIPPAMVGGVPTRGVGTPGIPDRTLRDVFSGFNLPSGIPGTGGGGPIPLGPLGNITEINIPGGPWGSGGGKSAGLGGDFGVGQDPRSVIDPDKRNQIEEFKDSASRWDPALRQKGLATLLEDGLPSSVRDELRQFMDNLDLSDEEQAKTDTKLGSSDKLVRLQDWPATASERTTSERKTVNVESDKGVGEFIQLRTPQGFIEQKIEKTDKDEQAARMLLNSISQTEGGRNDLWDQYKATEPRFRFMNPDAKRVYERYHDQLTLQYGIQSSTPGNPFFDPTGKKMDYKAYLEAAFDPNNPNVRLWNATEWNNNLNAAFTQLEKKVASEDFAASELSKVGPETQTSKDALGSSNFTDHFEVLGSDPEKVKKWIIYSTLAGQNPIAQRYGPQAITRSINKWLSQNMGGMTPDKQVGTDKGTDAMYNAMMGNSLLKEFMRRGGKWTD